MVSTATNFFKFSLLLFVMEKRYGYTLILIGGVAVIGIFIGILNANQTDNSFESNWYSFEEGLYISKKENKPMFVFISSPNCPFCAKMRSDVLSDPEVFNYIKNNYIPVYIDVGKEESPIKVFAYPAFVVIYKEKIVDAWGGYAGKELFLKKLKSIKIAD